MVDGRMPSTCPLLTAIFRWRRGYATDGNVEQPTLFLVKDRRNVGVSPVVSLEAYNQIALICIASLLAQRCKGSYRLSCMSVSVGVECRARGRISGSLLGTV